MKTKNIAAKYNSPQWHFMRRHAALHNLFRTFLSLTVKLNPPDPITALQLAVRKKMVSLQMSAHIAKQYMKEQAEAPREE